MAIDTAIEDDYMAVRYMDLLDDYIRELETNEKLRKEIRRLENEIWRRKFRR